MRDARFTIPTPNLLAKAVDLIDRLQMDDRDTKGDVYEYMLGVIAGDDGNPRTLERLAIAESEAAFWSLAPLPAFFVAVLAKPIPKLECFWRPKSSQFFTERK